METQKRRRNQVESDTLTHLRRSTLGILDAVAVQLPDVFYDEILPQLSFKDTCNLAQVNRAYRDAVWSAEGVRSLYAKLDDHVGFEYDQDPMYYMTLHGSSRAARALLKSGVDVNEVYDTDYSSTQTALHVAACHDSALVALDLIDAGADLNAQDGDGNTPLYHAVLEGHTSVVMVLTKSGADVNFSQCEYNDTLLEMAIGANHVGIAALLISCGADIRKIYNGPCPVLTKLQTAKLRDELREEEWEDMGKLIRVAERLAPSEYNPLAIQRG